MKFQKQQTSGHSEHTPRGDISVGGTPARVKILLLPLMSSKTRQIWQSSKNSLILCTVLLFALRQYLLEIYAEDKSVLKNTLE